MADEESKKVLLSHVGVAPSRLREVRERLNLSYDQLNLLKAPKTLVTKSKDLATWVREWEEGKSDPTMKKVRRLMDEVYHYPFIALFMPTLPQPTNKVIDFRATHEVDSPVFLAYKRHILALQETLAELVIANDEQPDLSFIGSVALESDPIILAQRLRDELYPVERPNKNEFFKTLRQKIEDKGVFVILKSDLITYQSRPDVNVLRGMALCDPVAPLIMVHKKDSQASQLFTLIHELAHLYLGQSGISNNDHFARSNNKVEEFCNTVAVEFFVPTAHLRRYGNIDEKTVSVLADKYHVSEVMVAYKAYRLGKTAKGTYEFFREQNNAQWRKSLEKKPSDKSQGNYNTTKKSEFGERVLTQVKLGISNEALSLTEASRLLQMKVSQFYERSSQ
jgi:Zn-dependent peptidase ImmA (M78 family)/DNA-binding transcriptional regulator YiaG